MPRTTIRRADIVHLWGYFFNDDAPEPTKREAAKVVVAVAFDIEGEIFRSKNRAAKQYREVVNKIADVGKYLAGGAQQFNRFFPETIHNVSFEIEGKNQLVIIPFKTDAVTADERVADATVVLYGEEMEGVTLIFKDLAIGGWPAARETLRVMFGIHDEG